ncbi:hypothetical protein [Methanolapillus africanus]
MLTDVEISKMPVHLKGNFVLNELKEDEMFLVVDSDRIKAHYSK